MLLPASTLIEISLHQSNNFKFYGLQKLYFTFFAISCKFRFLGPHCEFTMDPFFVRLMLQKKFHNPFMP